MVLHLLVEHGHARIMPESEILGRFSSGETFKQSPVQFGGRQLLMKGRQCLVGGI